MPDDPAPAAAEQSVGWPPALPPRPRRRRGLLVLAAGCLVGALALGLLAAAEYRSGRSAQAVVRLYFAALAGGDAAGALGLAADPPRGPYLTATVLREQLRVARLAGLHVGRATLHGGAGTVQVSYRLAFAGGAGPVTGTVLVTDTVPVLRRGRSWRLGRAAVSLTVTVPVAGADRLTFAGGPLPGAMVQVFPGALPLGTDRAAVRADGRPVARFTADRRPVEVRPVLTAAARQQLDQALDQALARCLDGTGEQRCPVPGEPRPVPGSLRGTVLPGQRHVTGLLAAGGRVTLTGQATVRGRWQDWDFDNQAVPRSGTVTVQLHALASVADLATVYWSTG